MAFKMPWGSGSGEIRPKSSKTDVSLDDILPTAALRVELVLLVVLCTDAMRADIHAALEVKDTSDPSAGAAKGEFSLIDFDDGNTQTIASNQKSQPSNRAYIHNLVLSSSELQNLKASATTAFNNWRTSVLRRLGETLKVQPDAVRRAKANYVSSQEIDAKTKQYQEYLDWAEGKDAANSASKNSTGLQAKPAKRNSFLTKLNGLDTKTRALILNATLFILLSLERYTAHSRVLLTHILYSLNLPEDILTSAEANVAMTLQQTMSAPGSASENGNATGQRPQAQQQPGNNKWKIGLAAIAGATLIGVTGGLAAPFLLGAAGAIMGGVGLGGLATLLGATIANPVTVAALFGVLGGRMGGKAMEEFAREVEDFEILAIKPNKAESRQDKKPGDSQTQMRVAIGISGHVLSPDDTERPWQIFSSTSYAPFFLRYEYAALLKLGTSLSSFLRDSGYTLAQAGALQVALPALSAALLPVSLLRLGSFLDNPFSIAMERSDKAGVVLAKALIAKVQGERPVTLVGFSVGARVIYSCLMELAKRGEFEIVENVVLIGGPLPSDQGVWIKMRTIVAGRLINVFTTDDVLLGYLYRVRYAQVGVAGLEAIDGVAGVENFDVTGVVKGHAQYRLAVGRVLRKVGLEGVDIERAEDEERALDQQNRIERAEHEKAKREGRLNEVETEKGEIKMMDADEEKPRQQNDRLVGRNDGLGDNVDLMSQLDLESPDQHDGRTMKNRNMNAAKDVGVDLQSEHETGEDEMEAEDEEEDEPIQMVDLDPTPEPHESEFDTETHPTMKRTGKASTATKSNTAEPEPETIRFGSPERGFNVSWKEK